MFQPSRLAVKQLNKIRDRGVTKGELIRKMEHIGFCDLDPAVPLETLNQLSEGLVDSDFDGSNPSPWVCTDNSTAIPKLIPLCLIGEELMTYMEYNEAI